MCAAGLTGGQDWGVTGTLALIGGADFGTSVDHHQPLFAPGSKIDLLPTAMAFEDPRSVAEAAVAHFAQLDVEVRVLDVTTRADAMDPQLVAAVEASEAIYLSGGSPMHLRSTLKDTPLLDALVRSWRAGATVAAAAESCSVLCSHMVDNRGGAFTVGLGLITSMTVITRFDTWSADKRHRTISLAAPDLVVAGIEDSTALVRASDGAWTVEGTGSVHVFRGGTPVQLTDLPSALNPEAGI